MSGKEKKYFDTTTNGVDNRPKADVSKYAITNWDDSRIKKAAAGLERYAPTNPGQGIMFSIIPSAPRVMAPTHWVENDDHSGTYICLKHLGEEPICCEALGEPKVRVNVLAAIYANTNGAGRLAKDTKPEITVGYIRLSANNHQTITNMLPDGVEPSQVDIVMTKAKRPGYEFALPSPGAKPRYLEAGLQDEVMQAAERWMDGQALVKRLGKELSPLGWRMLMKHLGTYADADVSKDAREEHSLVTGLKGIGETDDEQ